MPCDVRERHVLPDILADDLDVIFCGINPGLRAANAGHHFVGRSNRFWKVLHLAGFTPDELSPEDDHRILAYKCGLTTAVARPTAGADELAKADFVAGSRVLTAKIERFAPRYIAFLGKAAISAIQQQPNIPWGLQPTSFGGALAWVLPNPSGRNLAFSIEDLVSSYRALRLEIERPRKRGASSR